MKKAALSLIILFSLLGCSSEENSSTIEETMYFPPIGSSTWETKTIASLGWNPSQVQPLLDFLELKNTKGFIVLHNGKIVMEHYFNGHTANDTWQWNSAGKTLTATTIGIAQQENLININTSVSEYLGTGWTSEPLDKENLITSRHLLTMTSGINDENDLVILSNLTYLADAGTRWSYHNVFQKLMDVVAVSSGQTFENYFNVKLKNKIGMNGFWNNGIIYKIYHSNTRSMARFGLLALNKGKWSNEQIINPTYFNESITTSQNINPAYGYLWWLNGTSNFMLPGGQTSYSGSIVPNAPTEMYAAMGAADQRIYVIPSKKLVIVRMGEASNPANPNFAVSGFDNELWQKINAVIN
ncbi:serine hydrolase [Flavobacterium cucumis]|uniref:CubicO group peptidase, beta-lactamase class C family n=1 Tax=Flavobacterium cucumis TaxID=416016 RepID=A0A1M7ZSI8_9FLAO|nr:serine hydrolase [Flavobacterium cucumis]SHO71773.1 CubicO group peptidase, beta-lactamase class C family [Flavobacterium cucumis]